MINRGEVIAYSDLEALATLANTKLSPAVPFAFPPVDPLVAAPASLAGILTYGSGNYQAFTTLLVKVYAYQIEAGVKTYSATFAMGAAVTDGSGNPFKVKWTWTAAPGASGYVLTVSDQPANTANGVSYPGSFGGYFWDVGNVLTVTDTYDTASTTQWVRNFGSEPWPITYNGHYNSPVDNGVYLNELSRIRHYLFFPTPLNPAQTNPRTITDAWLVSGPWCVAAGTTCQAYSTGIYRGGSLIPIPAVKLFKNISLYTEHNTDTPSLAQALPTPTINSNNVSGPSNITDTWAFTGLVGDVSGTVVYTLGETNTGTDGRFPHVGNYTISVTGTGVSYVFSSPNVNTGVLTFTFSNVSTASPIIISITGPTPINAASYVNRTVSSMTYSNIYGGGAAGANCICASGTAYEIGPLPDAAFTYELSGSYNSNPFDSGVLPYYPPWTSQNPGVWSANTLPAWALYLYLSQDMPNYLYSSPEQVDRTRITDPVAPPGQPVVAGNNRPAMWPVYRDTDFGIWRNADAAGVLPAGPIPFWQSDPFHQFVFLSGRTAMPAVMDQLPNPFPLFVGFNQQDIKMSLTEPGLDIYIQRTTAPDPTSFDFHVTTGSFSLAALLGGSIAPWSAQIVFVGIFNTGAASVQYSAQVTQLFQDSTASYPGNAPVFFPINNDYTPQLEPYSYSQNLLPSSSWTSDPQPIPLLGYCVYDLTLVMPSVDNGSGIKIPSIAPPGGLTVAIGLMVGTTDTNPGTFQAFGTLTIPAGDQFRRTEVFWPVTSGAPLAYQCATSTVIVMAGVCYQPWANTDPTGTPWYVDYYCQVQNNTGAPSVYPRIVFPIFSDIINDLTAVLSLL